MKSSNPEGVVLKEKTEGVALNDKREYVVMNDKREAIAQYAFYMAFENTIKSGEWDGK